MSFAYVGCRTTRERNARGKGLKVYRVDHKTIEWQEIQLVGNIENPSYQCFDRNGDFLYTVHGDKDFVSAYKIDKTTGKLKFLNSAKAGGKNPVFVSVDATNRYCFVATLQGGKISTLARSADGSLTDPIHEAIIPGHGEGTVSLPHQCILDQSKSYLFAPAQGRTTGFGQTNVFRIEKDGSLTLTCRVASRKLDEPRHIASHANNHYVYQVNEKGNNITFSYFDEKAGILEPKQILPSLPDTYTGEGQASEVIVHPSNRFVYCSNRIHDSIATYSIDPFTGYLHCMGFTETQGETPRFVTTDPAGELLYVANEDSDTITVFRIDPTTGIPHYTGRKIETESPVCIIFSK
ncbi:lactonase family protein [Caproiciproducens sp. NJN-50]|uniref:lactonase family protein n=1 Tax=Acutalibacteraceae TaxID=3082771 RepID=UPI000FFE1693|nr:MULTISPECIES: lactonase family protein [Acutalibacteraceae]QAT49247.1 lactonase family protein [Caproiciproducens sp. NJN-50]